MAPQTLVKAGPRLPKEFHSAASPGSAIVFQGFAALKPEGFSEFEEFLLEDTQSFDLMPQERSPGAVRMKQS